MTGERSIMRQFNIVVLFGLFFTIPAMAADFVAPRDGTIANAITNANANVNGTAYSIEISEDISGSGTINKAVNISGDGVLSGALTFAGGPGINSEINNITITGGGTNGAIVNSSGFTASQAHNLILNNVTLDSNIRGSQGGAIMNTGVINVNGGTWSNNKASAGGDIYDGGPLNID